MTKHDEYRKEVSERNAASAAKQRKDAEAAGTALVKIKEIYAGVSNDQYQDAYVCAIPVNPRKPDYIMYVGLGGGTLEQAEKIVAEAKVVGVINRFDYSAHYPYGSLAWEVAGYNEFEILADRTGDSSYLDY